MRAFRLFAAAALLLLPASLACAERPFSRPPQGGQPSEGHAPWGEPGSTLEMAKRMEPDSYEAASTRASIEPTGDQRSFVVWKAPEGFDPKKGVTLVSLHGHAGWATRDFVVWEKEMKRRGWAYLGIQWWYGRSAESHGYGKPNDIYRWAVEALERHGVPPGRVIFQGFSMGSANSYAVTALDRLHKPPFFAATVSNAGPLETDFPGNRVFLESKDIFKGTHWVLYCGLRDTEKRDCCELMERSLDILRSRGATIDLFIRDPDGTHGSFMAAQNLDRGLDAAEENIGPA